MFNVIVTVNKTKIEAWYAWVATL